MLVLLHGSNASGPEMEPLARLLRPHFELKVPNLLGHGGRPVPDGYSLEDMTADLIDWLDRERIEQCDLFGYSVGGTLALHAARHHPTRVRLLATLAAKYVFDQKAVDHVVHLSTPARLARPESRRKAEMEQAHGAEHWEQVALNTCELFRRLGRNPPLDDVDLAAIGRPTLVICGENDPLVPAAEARQMAEHLPLGQLALFPGPAHPLSSVPLDRVARAFRTFVAEVEEGRSMPGSQLDIGERLVDGGLPGPQAKVRIRKVRD